jgi:hypothetical protein
VTQVQRTAGPCPLAHQGRQSVNSSEEAFLVGQPGSGWDVKISSWCQTLLWQGFPPRALGKCT